MVLTRDSLDDILVKRYGVTSEELGFDDDMITVAYVGFESVMRIR